MRIKGNFEFSFVRNFKPANSSWKENIQHSNRNSGISTWIEGNTSTSACIRNDEENVRSPIVKSFRLQLRIVKDSSYIQNITESFAQRKDSSRLLRLGAETFPEKKSFMMGTIILKSVWTRYFLLYKYCILYKIFICSLLYYCLNCIKKEIYLLKIYSLTIVEDFYFCTIELHKSDNVSIASLYKLLKHFIHHWNIYSFVLNAYWMINPQFLRKRVTKVI